MTELNYGAIAIANKEKLMNLRSRLVFPINLGDYGKVLDELGRLAMMTSVGSFIGEDHASSQDNLFNKEEAWLRQQMEKTPEGAEIVQQYYASVEEATRTARVLCLERDAQGIERAKEMALSIKKQDELRLKDEQAEWDRYWLSNMLCCVPRPARHY
jgi:hypothetical protein